MKNQPLKVMAFGVFCLIAAGAWAQNSSEGSTSSGGSSWGSGTSRMGQQELKASTLTGAGVMDSSGEKLGSIKDVIINPRSGRVDFAVLTLNSSGSTPAYSDSSRQVAVPWMLLRSSNMAGTPSGSSSQPSFAFTGDASKLHSAPAFDPDVDLSQSTWGEGVFSHFGVTPGSATGGSESPGGSGSSGGGYGNPGGR